MLSKIPFEIIAVDFDGTLCVDDFPAAGEPNEELIKWLKIKQGYGTRIILWTCRCGECLDYAVDWCSEHGLVFDAINDNIPGVVAVMSNSNSRKVFADIYIDDKGACGHLPGINLKLPYMGEKNE
jgi:hypothetical protein